MQLRVGFAILLPIKIEVHFDIIMHHLFWVGSRKEVFAC